MTKEQRKKAVEILKSDCEIQFKYICEGQTCAIGALALAGGFDKEILEAHNGSHVHIVPGLLELLHNVYGITEDVAKNMQLRNDWTTDHELRREKVIGCL
jgi:hypothetical protein